MSLTAAQLSTCAALLGLIGGVGGTIVVQKARPAPKAAEASAPAQSTPAYQPRYLGKLGERPIYVFEAPVLGGCTKPQLAPMSFDLSGADPLTPAPGSASLPGSYPVAGWLGGGGGGGGSPPPPVATQGVPSPAVWSLMLSGFGCIGVICRLREPRLV